LVNIGDSAIYAAIGYSAIGSLTDLWQLKMDTVYCDLYDTTFVNDTTFITDTLFVNDTTFYNDTTFIDVYDTTYVSIYDTTEVLIYDTTEVTIYDTSFITVYDTTYVQINDTSTVLRYDTIQVYVIDTIYYSVFDTIRITHYDTLNVTLYRLVDDTLNVYLYDSTGGCGNLEIKIYPNPTSEFVYLFTKQSGCLEAAKITLYDQLGKTLQTIIVSEDITRIDVRGYAKELYFLKLQDKTGRELFTRKIIIR
jgi:hypothetical protein